MQTKAIPVLLIGFNRPELLTKRVNELLRNNVTTLHISVDGCESFREIMKTTLESISEICANRCDVTFKIHEQNYGLSKHITSEISKMLTVHTEVIVLEDDIQIGDNFLTNMAKGLMLSREMNLKGVVSGFSPLTRPKYLKFSNHWRSTPYFNCWGWLCTRETWSNYVLDISKLRINDAMSNSATWKAMNKWQQFLWISRFRKIQRSPYHTWDIQFQYMCFKYEITNISPIFSLTNNQGFDDIRSVHTKGKKPRWMSKSRVDSSIISSKCATSASFLFSKIIEPLTTSGDSRLIRLRNRIKN